VIGLLTERPSWGTGSNGNNGAAGPVNDVLEFYEKRFQIGFTPQEKEDLIAFLNPFNLRSGGQCRASHKAPEIESDSV
jgi:hypothetical protein